MFSYLFALAIGLGTSIIVGRLVGSGDKDEVYVQVWASLKRALVFTVILVALVMTFRYPLMRLFTDNENVIELGASVLLLSCLLETGRTFNMVIINSLRASGDAKFPVLMGAISMVMMSLPLGYFLVFVLDLGLVGVWLAVIMDEWTRAIIMSLRWKSRAWERYALVEPVQEVQAKPEVI